MRRARTNPTILARVQRGIDADPQAGDDRVQIEGKHPRQAFHLLRQLGNVHEAATDARAGECVHQHVEDLVADEGAGGLRDF